MARPSDITIDVSADVSTLAADFDAIAEAFAQAAHSLRKIESDRPQEASPAVTEASWTETDDWAEGEPGPNTRAGSAAVCPAHGEPYRDGKFGPYCASLGTDPKWTNARGYCQITPKNAAAYLRQKAAR